MAPSRGDGRANGPHSNAAPRRQPPRRTLTPTSVLRRSGNMGRNPLEHAAPNVRNALPGVADEPYSKEDLVIIAEILQVAEKRAASESCAMSLMLVLQAYEEVLWQHGLDPCEDTFFYRCLLKLSLYTSADWWARFKSECLHNEEQSKAVAFRRRQLLSRAWLKWRWGPREARLSFPHHHVQLIPQKLPKKASPIPKAAPGGVDLSLELSPLEAEDEEAFQGFKWLAICFRIWRCNIQILKILRKERETAEAKWGEAETHWKAATAKRTFFSWRSFAAAKERAVKGHVLWRTFGVWRGQTRWKKEAETASALHYHRALVSSAFAIWVPKGRDAAAIHASVLHTAKLRKLKRVVVAWRLEARAQSRLRTCHRNACERIQELRKEQCLKGWQSHWRRKLRAHTVVQQCVEEFAARKAVRILGFWTNWAVRKRERTRLGAQLEERLAGRRIQQALRAWAHWFKRQQDKRDQSVRAETHFAASIQRSSFLVWRRRAMRDVRLRALTVSAERILTNKSVSRVMRCWLGVKKGRVAREQLLAECKRAYSHRAASKAWAIWREAFLTRTVVMAHRLRVKLGLLRSVLWALKENARYRLWKKEAVHTAGRMHRQARMRGALEGWWEYTGYKKEKARLQRSATRMCRSHVLRNVLRDWEARVEERQEQKAVCLRALSYWQRRGVARAFNTWRGLIAQNLHREERIRKTIMRWQNHVLASAFGTWRDGVECYKEGKAVADSCIQRWRVWRVLEAWEVWRQVVDKRKEDKETMREVVTVWSNTLVASAWRRWTEHTAEALYQKALLRKTLGHLVNTSLSRAFNSLRAYAAAKKRGRDAVQKMRRGWKLSCKKAFVEQLRAAVKSGKQKKAVIKYFGGQLCARAWHAWADACERAREVRVRADRSAQQRGTYIQNEAFLQWRALKRASAHRRVSVANHLAERARTMLANCFAEWQARVGHVSGKADKLRMAQRFDQRSSCRVALREWKAWHKVQKSKVWALGLWSEGCLKSAFLRWRKYVHVRVTLRKRLPLAVERHQTRTLSVAFRWWKTLALFQSHLREKGKVASAKGERALLRRTLKGWAHTAASARVAVKRWRASWLQKGLKGLLRHAQRERRLRSAAQAAISRWADGEVERACAGGALEVKAGVIARELWRKKCLLSCLTAWQAWKEGKRWSEEANELAERCWREGYKERGFRAWRQYREARLHGYDAKEKADERWHDQEMTRVLRGWREHAAAAPVLRRALAFRQKGQLNLSFAHWRELARVGAQKRVRIAHAVSFWNTYSLRAAFSGWKSGWEARKEKKRVCMRALGFWHSSRLALAFATWKEGFSYRKDVRTRVEQALLHNGARMALAVLSAWMAVVERKHQRELRIQSARAKKCTGVCRSIIAFWKDWAEERAHGRALVQKARAQRTLKLTADVLRQWLEVAKEKKHYKAVLGAVVKTWQQRTIRGAFESWALKVGQKKRNFTLLNHAVVLLTQRVLYSSFHQWRDVTEARQAARAVEEMAIEHDCRRLLKKALSSWINRMENVFRVNLLRERHGRRVLARALEGFRVLHEAHLMKRHAEALYQRKLVAEAWAAWKEYRSVATDIANAGEHLSMRVAANYRHALMAAAFDRMRAHVRVKRALRELVRSWQQGALCRAFRRWARLISTRKAAAALFERVRKDRMREILQDWNYTAKNIRREEAEIARIAALCHGTPLGARATRALARWECLTQARAFDQWVHWCQERELQRAHTTRAFEARYKKLLMTSVAGFRKAVEGGRRRRWGEGMRERNLKRSHWRLWAAYYNHRQAKHAATESAVRHWKRTLLYAWKRRVRIVRAQREANATALLAYARRVKMAGWLSWRHVVARRRERFELLALVVIRMENFRLRNVLASWKAILNQRKAVRQRVTTFRRVHTEAAARCQLRAWQGHVQRQKFLQAAAHSFRYGHMLGRALSEWARAAREQKADRRAVNLVHYHLLDRVVRPAFAHWGESASREKDARAKGYVPTDGLRPLLHTWRNSEYKKIHRMAVMDAVNYRARMRRQAAAFAIWLEHAASSCRLRGVLERTLCTWAHNRLHVAFEGWLQGIEEQKRLREVVTRAGLRWRQVLLARAFDGWQDRVACFNRQRAAASLALASLRHPLARAAFNSWAHFAAASARQRMAVERMVLVRERRMRARAFREWKCFMQDARRLKRKTFQALRLHQRIWRDEAAAHFAERSSLLRAFKGWTRWHSKCAAVRRLQAARAHQLYRDPFLGWKEVVAWRKRASAAEKELAAKRLRSHVHHCYRTWRHVAKAVRHYRASTLRQTLKAWRLRHSNKAYWRTRARQATRAITSARVQRMVWAWQQLAHEMGVVREEHHRRQLALREAYGVAEKSARRRQVALCQEVFLAWKSLKDRSLRVAAFTSRHVFETKADAWRLWRFVILQQKETDTAARAFACANQLWRCMQRWKGFWVLCEQRRGALARCWEMLEAGEERRVLHVALHEWRGATAEKKRKRGAYAHAARYRATRLLTDHFQSWAAYTAALEDTSHRLRTAVACYTSEPEETPLKPQTLSRRAWSLSSPAKSFLPPRREMLLDARPTRRGDFFSGSPEYTVPDTEDAFARALSPPRGLYSPPRVRSVPVPEKLPSPADWRAFSNPLAAEEGFISPPNTASLVEESRRREGRRSSSVERSERGKTRTDSILGYMDRKLTQHDSEAFVAPLRRFSDSFQGRGGFLHTAGKVGPSAQGQSGPPIPRRQRGRWSTPAAMLLPRFDEVANGRESRLDALAEPEIVEL